MKLYGPDSKFTTEEFACRCGCGFGTQESDISFQLIATLNLIRQVRGKPMIIDSGARCVKRNKDEDGALLSAHLPHPVTGQCQAADIRVGTSEDRFHLLRFALMYGIKRIGIGKTFLHVDVSDDLPNPLIWLYT